MPESFVERLKWDIPASFVVFLVALPLSLGIALASGAPLESGLIAAVAGGIVVSLAGGAPLQVSGPAAGLTVLVFALIQKHGFETTCLIVILAGFFQMVAINIKITGSHSFLNVPRLQNHLQSLPPGPTIRIQLDVKSMDAAAIEALRAWRTSYEATGGKVSKPSLNETWVQLSEERSAHRESGHEKRRKREKTEEL